jgi:hypothetical protein
MTGPWQVLGLRELMHKIVGTTSSTSLGPIIGRWTAARTFVVSASWVGFWNVRTIVIATARPDA